MPNVRVTACQINTSVGDIEGNVERILEALSKAEELGSDIAIFPELAITSYPPEDLLLKPGFIARNIEAMHRVAEATRNCVAVFGFVDREQDLFNSAAICHDGQIIGRYHKRILPNYGVFDEQRYFAAGPPATTLYGIAGTKVGVTICEDVWSPNGPVAEQAAAGAELILAINSSPFFAGKRATREAMLATRAADASVSLVYVNQVGGQDELVFDGASVAFDSDGNVLASANQFAEELLTVDIEVKPTFRKRLLDPRGRATAQMLPVEPIKSQPTPNREAVEIAPRPISHLSREAEIYNAIVVGVGDYVRKNGFEDVVIGLSGGFDSSLVAAIAVDALGAGKVHGVSMPSRYSSPESEQHARELAERLGIDFRVIPIEIAHRAFSQMFEASTGQPTAGTTDENLQSRIRGVTLMALSNEFGWLVLTTGNKSELAVGYSTLYGDTAGGFAVIKDVVKTTAYKLCEWRNEQARLVREKPVISQEIFTKVPTAELRPGQKDEDSLPLYAVLDPIVDAYVEDDLTLSEIVQKGFDPEIVARIVRMVDGAEYKRRQSPLGVRVTPKAFGKDRRVPITNRFV